MNLKTSILGLLVIAVASCGLVSAASTNVEGTLGASAAISGLASEQSLPAGAVNTLVIQAALDGFTVDANAGWTIQVSGGNLVSDDEPSDTATNALQLYCSADGADTATHVDLPTAGDGSAEFSGNAGAALSRGIKFGQEFEYSDSPNAANKKYASTVTLAITAA